MKNLLKYAVKELSGGQDLKPVQRAIFMWWILTLMSLVIFAESATYCFVGVVMFALSSHFLKKLPTPKDNSPEL